MTTSFPLQVFQVRTGNSRQAFLGARSEATAQSSLPHQRRLRGRHRGRERFDPRSNLVHGKSRGHEYVTSLKKSRLSK